MPTYTDPVMLDSTGQDIVTQLQGIAAALPGGSSKADKTDLASIQATGTTNLTGATITAGTYFYLNGTLVQAIGSGISNGAPFTLNTNYAVVTAGALNELKSALSKIQGISFTRDQTNTTWSSFGMVRYADHLTYAYGGIDIKSGGISALNAVLGHVDTAFSIIIAIPCMMTVNGNFVVGAVSVDTDGTVKTYYGSGTVTGQITFLNSVIAN